MSDLIQESSNKKKGLGRGLGSLLGGGPPPQQAQAAATQTTQTKVMTSQLAPTPAAAQKVEMPVAAQAAPAMAAAPASTAPVDPESKIWKVAIEKLQPGQYQPRRSFEKQTLQELSISIKENGILQPIVARRTQSGKLEIVAGERRWRAAQLAGLIEVPVILKSFNDKEALELAIVENIQREDLNPIDEAEGYQRLITEFKLTQQQVADKVGKERATVANSVRILVLPEEVKSLIASKELSLGHAKVLLSLPNPAKQSALAKQVIQQKLPVRKLEKIIQAELDGGDAPAEVAAPFDANVTQRLIAGLSEEIQKMLGTKVSIDYGNSKGKISIHFYSDDELTQIVEKLREGCQSK